MLIAVVLPVVALAVIASKGVPQPDAQQFDLPVYLVAAVDTITTPDSPGPEPEGRVSPAAMEQAGVPVEPPPVEPANLVFSISNLLIPVAGIGPEDLVDTFTDRRSGGRIHNAMDIVAERGTPVVAVSDGRIIRKHTNRLGGHVLYLRSPNGRYAFYYAHLDDYADGIEHDALVLQGDTLGFVGNSGNARHTVSHLHFQIIEAGRRSDRRVYGGRKLNPYPLLRHSDAYADNRNATVRG
ncbi:MAG: M23 family metallopeptidase [Rubricoccaceae bacterium]|nr:M23 family metallopeptidase [Rubricoccaceae bacterium]